MKAFLWGAMKDRLLAEEPTSLLIIPRLTAGEA
jgi:hypothetical protein